ncbi:MAG TPA: helix-turn-helix domain-containing protein [Solirubrobacteraceae bacterium]|nr:helix-turn-helix domain-containing protein [Solirubrobacteraceae bacterium]
MTPAAGEKIRDAERSREAILAAAEQLFADHGYEGASLNEIAVAAGLSRGTPSYFFGSKERLYREVIERTFAAREEATRSAFGPVMAWCESDGGLGELRAALTAAARDYMDFLARRSSFVKLVMREELAGGASIRARQRASTAMEDAFEALRAAGAGRGIRGFVIEDAVLLFIALTFAPLSYLNTWMRAAKRDLRMPADREHQVELAVTQLMDLLTG